MCESLRHRGPDSEGAWKDHTAGIGMAHRRLSIRDLSEAGHQPIVSKSGDAVLVYNGELYAIDAMRQEIEQRGIILRGHSDSEVLVEAIDLWGVEETLPRLNGMFAFAVWNRRTRQLTLARDRIGIKPLYWAQTGSGVFLFGSELRALRQHPGLNTDLDRGALQQYLLRLCVPAPRTILASCRKLEPGCMLQLDAATLGQKPRLQRWWAIEDAVEEARGQMPSSRQEAMRRLDALVVDATHIRLVSDVPVGVLLSGGVDSSLVAACVAAELGAATRTYSIGTPSADLDESGYARAIATHLGTTHTELTVSDREAMECVECMPSLMDEPFADSSFIPTYVVSRMASGHVTVALSGDGGDEFFGGYNRYTFMLRAMRRIAKVPRSLRSLASGVSSIAPTQLLSAIDRSSRWFLGSRCRIDADRMRLFGRLMRSNSQAECYASLMATWDPPPLLQAEVGVVDPLKMRLASLAGRPLLDQLALADATTYLPNDVLTKVDRASMACSLEVRVPLLDHRVAAWGAAMPVEWRFEGSVGKLPLRSLLGQRVPAELWSRPKKGFAAPMPDWLRGALRPWAESLLTRDRLEECGLDSEPIHAAWARLQGGGSYDAVGIWSVLMLIGWIQQPNATNP